MVYVYNFIVLSQAYIETIEILPLNHDSFK